ncbi:MAG: hypothetical protein QG654_454 [Patescibacteria group bacterium]|jgi:hypothetical protein|nr:hypothetical protein [Patescibacteria group bacterium]
MSFKREKEVLPFMEKSEALIWILGIIALIIVIYSELKHDDSFRPTQEEQGEMKGWKEPTETDNSPSEIHPPPDF